jgi:cytochrome c biogenesis protein ResB
MKLIGGIIGILTLFGILFGVHEWQENRYAHNTALAQAEKKIDETKKTVDYHIINQQREALEYRVERQQEKYQKKPTPDGKELLDDLKKRLAEKEKELKRLEIAK